MARFSFLLSATIIVVANAFTGASSFVLRARIRQEERGFNMSNPGGAEGKELKYSEIKNLPVVKSASSPIVPLLTIILACTRPIPVADCFFSIGYPAYLYLANRFRFDQNAPGIAKGWIKTPQLREGAGPWFKNYLLTFGTIGVIFPLAAQVFAPRSIADAAAPHLYLLMCQLVMETASRAPEFYPLTQLLVPIGFNAYRLLSIRTWLGTAWRSFGAAPRQRAVWEAFGLALACANAVVWTYNLFVFLLLRVLPQYINRDEFPEAKVSWKGQVFPVLDKNLD